ncbi:hypothetical protein SAMN04487967_0095 [Natronorubrum sediminis]|uniref:MYM-type domain-containing protein n=2 Tax=Natronorubrum TaxID=134813 RepID=A0A1N6XEU7_9EURY|nr:MULTISPECIES: hypothetical protein [Natronorubrum]SEH10874.1 hypothetical protein SAMN04487967_0095 [Natronorubrum sediminis]SIR00787.1 hypothetical protein SAMN05421809_0093 [Natronorubrum daqingense]
MSCDNCSATAVAYTLRTHVTDSPGEQIDLHFCSSECLRVWT